MLNLYDWGSSIATVEPLGPGRIKHINWYFFTDVSPEKAEENRKSAEWSAQIVTEDLNIITGVQRNLNAGVYDRGPLSPKYEAAVKRFQDMVREELGPRVRCKASPRNESSLQRVQCATLVATHSANDAGIGELAT